MYLMRSVGSAAVRPLGRRGQIIEMVEEKDGDETLFKFELKEANLASILDKVGVLAPICSTHRSRSQCC